jgi:hypothetical protein
VGGEKGVVAQITLEASKLNVISLRSMERTQVTNLEKEKTARNKKGL